MQLTAVPDGSSPCPYEIASKKRNAEEAAREDEQLGQQVGCLVLRAARQLSSGEQQGMLFRCVCCERASVTACPC